MKSIERNFINDPLVWHIPVDMPVRQVDGQSFVIRQPSSNTILPTKLYHKADRLAGNTRPPINAIYLVPGRLKIFMLFNGINELTLRPPLPSPDPNPQLLHNS